jgi:hypothetical protein
VLLPGAAQVLAAQVLAVQVLVASMRPQRGASLRFTATVGDAVARSQ